jgi:Putative beta-barrel porin-2, OmpL-like. bbp2
MIGYPFSDVVSANLYVVNGWDNFNDEGNSKTLGLSVSVTPADQFSAVVNLMNGREADLQTGIESNRFLSDTILTLKPVKNLTFVVNTDYATQSGSALEGGDVKWYGVAGYVKYDFSDLFSSTVRAEYFKDPDGARTLTAQTAKEITLTPEFRVAKNLIVRPEYRHDWSNKDVFDSQHGTFDKKSQDTIALGVMYTW